MIFDYYSITLNMLPGRVLYYERLDQLFIEPLEKTHSTDNKSG